jgi:hypothetical protein
MKVLVEHTENEGLESLMGKVITLFCINYIYTGKLVGVNDTCVKLEDPKIVYETGSFNETNWKDAQLLPHKYFYVARQAVESFGELK